MTLNDFKLSDLLEFKPQEGRLMLGQDRMLLFRHAAFSFLHKVLREQLGEHVTHAILSQFGYKCGFGDFEVLSSAFAWETEHDQLGCGPLMHGWEGIVAVEPLHMEFDRETGHFEFSGIWRNSYEAVSYLANHKIADKPICSSLTGYASGWCSAFFGQELLAVEQQCVGMGHEYCTWRIRPVKVWGDSAAYWRDALEATNLSIATDLERQVQARTREISDMLEVLRVKNLQLEELDRLKSEFLANVSHELRTPLTLLLGPLQSLLQTEAHKPSVHGQLERMHRSATRLHRLVNQLLDFARCEQKQTMLQRQWVEPAKILQHILEEAGDHALNKHLRLTQELSNEIGKVALDPEKFEKIAINLLGNALKFSGPGDQVCVELTREASALVLIVSDTGPGIDASDHERIFNRFQQVDASPRRRHEGTGIGLALVKEYTELHGGQVGLTSTLGVGCRFEVRLPLVDSAAAESTHEERDSAEHFADEAWEQDLDIAVPEDNGDPLILIAEDNPDLRGYMVDLLSSRFRILQVQNGLKALEATRRFHPKVILTDVMMPGLDGLGLVQQLKADPDTKHIPIILVTARAGSEASVSGLHAGADDYIVKPFTDQELGARVDAALRMRLLYDRVTAQNEQLVQEIARREQAEQERNTAQKQLLLASREAGRAEVATSILHDAGNLLNSMNTSISTLIGEDADQPVILLQKIVTLIESQNHDLCSFFESPRGKAVIVALRQICSSFQASHSIYEEELQRIAEQVGHLAVIVSEQNDFTQSERFTESTDINALVLQAIELSGIRYGRFALVEHFYSDLPEIVVDRHKILQILFNLIKNAKEAFSGVEGRTPEISVRTSRARDSISVEVSDNGMGIPKDILLRIFNSGFTTKPTGHGFGLHSSANLAREMGGKLSAFSNGQDRGASFTLWLPC